MDVCEPRECAKGTGPWTFANHGEGRTTEGAGIWVSVARDANAKIDKGKNFPSVPKCVQDQISLLGRVQGPRTGTAKHTTYETH